MNNRLERKISKTAEYFQNICILQAIRRGFVMIIPVVIIGALTSVLLQLPIEQYQQFMKSVADGKILRLLQEINRATYGTISVLLVPAVSYSYSEIRKNTGYDLIALPIISIASYMVLIGINDKAFNISDFGARGMFTALISTSCVCVIYHIISENKWYQAHLNKMGIDSVLIGAIKGTLPGLFIILLFSLTRILFIKAFDVNNVQDWFSDVISAIFDHMQIGYLSALLITICISLMHFMGIQGRIVMESVSRGMFGKEVGSSQDFGIMSGRAEQVLNREFFDVFVSMGGVGTVLCLVLAILLFVKNKRIKNIVKIGTIPVVFNIGEIITFGLPVVLNPVMFIPFVLVPMVSLTISYFAMYVGIVPEVTHKIESTTPIFISGYESTGSINGAILQVLLVAIGVMIYKPFVKAYAQSMENTFITNIQTMEEECILLGKKSTPTDFVKRSDDIGVVARVLAEDLERDIRLKRLVVLYQVQMNDDKECIGAEALIRWKHTCGYQIHPQLTIALAKESELLHLLEKYLLDSVCSDIRYLEDNQKERVHISVNLTLDSVKHSEFENMLEDAVIRYGIERKHLWFEINEDDAILAKDEIENRLYRLKNQGHKLLVDTFGTGNTAMIYLQNRMFDFIKIDGSVTKQILTDERSSNIISTMVGVGNTMGYTIIAQYVETKEQQEKLRELGCFVYQGYLYSQPVKFDKMIELIDELES